MIFLMDGLMPALTSNTDLAKQGISHLGYPDYFRVMLTCYKIIGAIMLVLPVVKGRVKEWVYAGFTIIFISALIAHIAGGLPLSTAVMPIVMLLVLLVSYFGYLRLFHGVNPTGEKSLWQKQRTHKKILQPMSNDFAFN